MRTLNGAKTREARGVVAGWEVEGVDSFLRFDAGWWSSCSRPGILLGVARRRRGRETRTGKAKRQLESGGCNGGSGDPSCL